MNERKEPPDLDRLLRLEHPDPHAILGAHPAPGGVVIRALRPDAAAIAVLEEGSAPRPMVKIHDAGIFEVVVRDRRQVFPYRLSLQFPDGNTWVEPDAYAFLPTLGDLDLHLIGEGRHERLFDVMGAHMREHAGVRGVAFSVWAPAARGVSVTGDWNGWDGRRHPMRLLGSSGIWELFVPGVESGSKYKFEIHTESGDLLLKADPYAAYAQLPPDTASRVFDSHHQWQDHAFLSARASVQSWRAPMSIYEMQLGSWRDVKGDGSRPNYRELAAPVADYLLTMGFTHVELMPVQEHPFDGSWGYQVSGYFAPTSRYGTPDDFRFFVDYLHQQGLGVIVDWVPAHFPKDAFALGRFDGSALYEHLDPRQGEHPDWGTFIFNFGRKEVRNFLMASALSWIEQFHIDGLRVDAVASMLYLDYSRPEGQWVANAHGGRENLDAIAFLRELNEVVHRRHPGALMIAEESTAWAGVSRPTHLGGLGFGFKWNMGWMHDVLDYFEKDPVHRRYHHHQLTFGLIYAWHENFVLPFSHDEVVHGKRSMLDKMPGDRWQKFANLRALYGFQWAHPGKKLLFQGSEIGEWGEWSEKRCLDWRLLEGDDHRGLQRLVADLNRRYQGESALWEADDSPAGFQWIDAQNADDNVLVFMRMAPTSGRRIVCACNFAPVARPGYRLGLPGPGTYTEILNTDATVYGGSNVGNAGGITAVAQPHHGQPYSAVITLPPLAVVWFAVP